MTTYYAAQLGIALSTLNLEQLRLAASVRAVANTPRRPNIQQKRVEIKNKLTKKLRLNKKSK